MIRSIMRCLYSYKFILWSAISWLLFQSCKKDVPIISEPIVRTADQQLKDSVYYYYKRYSLWSDALIPAGQIDSTFTNAYDSPLNVLDALKGMTPYHAAYRGAIDRFSYLESIDPGAPLGYNLGFGLFVSIGAVSETMAYPVVYFAEGGSPAAQAGIKRSDVILGINEYQDFSVPVTCETGNCKVLDDKRYQSVLNNLLAAMAEGSMKIRLRHVDGSESTVTILSGSYVVNPIIKDTVFSYSPKHIGYIALSSFEEASAGHVNRIHLDRVFQGFEQGQVKDLVFDLRYNTGGSVSTVEYIANKVIGQHDDQALMYKYGLNDYLSPHKQFKGYSFEDVYFKRDNNLNLSTIYFLVTDITASASELLINVLRPYMNVVIIAEHDGTYGKPVGYFKQDIMGRTSLWVASFKLINARGETNYWDGISADQKNVADYIFRDFGDVEEYMLAAAINHSLGRPNAAKSVAGSRKMSPPMRGRIVNVNKISEKKMIK